MAWVSPKVYAILSKSEEGKDIIERLPDLTQEECQSELDAFFGNGGKGASQGGDYAKAKAEKNKGEMPKSSYYLMDGRIVSGDGDFESHANINRKEGRDLYAEDKAIAINPGVYGSKVMKIDVPKGPDITDYEYSHLVEAIDSAQRQGKTIDLGMGYTFNRCFPVSDILEAIYKKRRGR